MSYQHRHPVSTKACEGCGKEFSTRLPRQRFCQRSCSAKKSAKMDSYQGVDCGTIGSIGELLVAADLMIKGYEVFRAMSPSASCDLIVLRAGHVLRMEVRTGYLVGEKLVISNKKHEADVLAVNVKGVGIIYQPDMFKGMELL